MTPLPSPGCSTDRALKGCPRSMTMSDDQFLTTDEVLAYLQLNLKTVYRLIKAGKLPAVRVGHQWRFRKRDIDAWLSAGRKSDAMIGAMGDPSSVLVVDDDEGVRNVIAATLSKADAGYDIAVAADGPAALAMLRVRKFDLLISDLKMPGMDGLTLIREARRLAPNLPVVIITGAPSEASAIEAVNLGVSGYLLKPFRVPDVLDVVARALGSRESRADLPALPT
jgi:excisionase family DNA binding protein